MDERPGEHAIRQSEASTGVSSSPGDGPRESQNAAEAMTTMTVAQLTQLIEKQVAEAIAGDNKAKSAVSLSDDNSWQ